MANELVRILEERLPEYYTKSEQRDALMRMGSDVSGLRETFNEYVNDRSYSDSNEQGPIEVSIDTGELEEAFDRISESYRAGNQELANSIRGSNQELLDSIEESNRGLVDSIGEGNELLQEICDHQDGMASSLRHANVISSSNLAVNILSLGVAVKTLEELEDMNDGFSDQLDEIDYELEGISSELADVNENLEEIASNQERGLRLQKRTNHWLKEITNGVKDLEVAVVECFSGIALQQEKMSSQINDVHRALLSLSEGQERMRTEVVGTMTELAKNSLSLRADEKYSFAYDQYKIGNYSAAIKDLRAALKERSTHLPSLLLLGALSTRYAKWSDAKDTFYHAAQLAKLSNDIKSYHSAMIGLANVEFLVQNGNLAQRVIKEAAEHSYSPELDKAYLKMRARRLK